MTFLEAASAVDRFLLRVNRRVQYTVIAATVLHMIVVAIPNVPRAYVDYARFPLLSGVHQYDTYGTDTIGNSYVAKVVLNDPLDMYTKARLEQTPLEKATWTREASAPYPPAALLTAAGLYAIGAATGIEFYGMVVLLAALFVALSLWYFLNTRWYLFPLLYLNFAYFGHRFVYVQDDSYLAMLVVVMIALVLARSRREVSHILMALAITMKLSPAAYAREILTMRRGMAIIFAAILFAGFVLPYFIWDNYLTIFTFHDQVKGNIYDTIAAVALVVPFTIVLWYVETRLGFDMEDRIGWSLVPFGMFVGIKMRVARHLLIVLLVPDKRGPRNIAAAIGLALHAAAAGCVPTRVGALHHDRSALRIPGALSAENRLGHGSRRRAASAAHPQDAAVGAATRFDGGIVSLRLNCCTALSAAGRSPGNTEKKSQPGRGGR